MDADRTVLTTGANSGIGLATALAVARRGFRSVASVRSTVKAERVSEAAEKQGLKVETVLLDVTDAGQCREVIDELHPWGLVNNAGFGHTGAIEDVGDAEARTLMETMVVAPMRLARLALPFMRAAGGGRIVNMSSIFGLTSAPLTGWYAGAKHALEALSDALRVEVVSAGVRVTLVEPGGIRTELWDDVASGLEDRKGSPFDDDYHRSLSATSLSRPLMGSPEQVADVVVRALTPAYRGTATSLAWTPAPCRSSSTPYQRWCAMWSPGWASACKAYPPSPSRLASRMARMVTLRTGPSRRSM